MIKIGSIGYNHSHKNDFCVNNPNGPGAWLFLLIKTEAILNLNGKDYDILPGTIVIISPRTPCSYRAKKDVYIDDWFYFDDIGDEDIKALNSMSININEPMRIGSFTEISGIIYTLAVEFYSANVYHTELVELYTQILFKMISRSITEGSSSERGISTGQRENLHYIKTWIYREPENIPSVSVIAESFGMSLSSLEHLYKKTFNINIKQDIVNSRMICAKRLLLSTNLTVAEIGEKCGYLSSYGFMRQFKQYIGVTPTEYRKYQAVGE